MIRTASLLLLALAALSPMMQTAVPVNADGDPGPGIPFTLAEDRARRISDLRYDLRIAIPPDRSAPVTGAVVIRFSLTDASKPLALDFRKPARITGGRDAAALVVTDDHVIVPAARLREGANEVSLEFVAGDAALNRNAEFLYTLFVPARAHLTFPCFDQPDLKAKWTLTLSLPDGWRALTNAPLTAVAGPDGTPLLKSGETPPLSTYVFAFAAGRFSVETAERDGRSFTMLHRETDAAKVARNKDAIFDLHAASLAWLENYTGIPYPWGKFDFVLVPSFQFGGMEHPGAIFYNASSLLLDPSATQNQKLGRASLIAHETAHMWFGDLVTMRWFNDVWMKEVFANFMAAKIVNPSFPAVNHDLRFLLSNYPAAYEVDRTSGANPIRQQLDNLQEAGSMYGAIIYQKAPVVMRHLEALLGEDNFRDGLREYLQAHAFANATWPDLINVLDARTPLDLQQWSRSWVDMPGRPTIETVLEVKNGSITRLAFRQRDTWNNRNLTWTQQLRVAVGDGPAKAGPHERIVNVEMTGREVEVKEAVGWPAPTYVLPNGRGWAYGDFVLDKTTLAYLMTNLPDIQDPLTRGSAWVTLWDALLDARVQPDALLDLAMRSLPRESDEQMTSRILGYAANTWWRFLDQPQRMTRAARFESLLREGLASAKTPSQKASWFGTLRNISLTPGTVTWLRQVWEKKETVQGLPLAEADYTSLALDLAVRQVDGWTDILKTQLTRIENPDRKGRFQFVMPALSADPAERDRWFQSLKDVNNRRREPWVLEGLNYLHHPLRADASKQYVRPSLELLWDIQKTGDIFFPNNWLDATLGGYQTKEVADTVRDFLKSLPANYPDRLRNITLQSADELYRAAEVVKK